MAAGEVKVKGLRNLHRNLKNYDQDAKRGLEQELVATGNIVKAAAVGRATGLYSLTPSFRSKVRGFGRVTVGRTRTKRKRGDFGSLLMRRALLPALNENERRVTEAVDRMLDRVARSNSL